ncbi:sialidase [Chloropicon primus]|uniref:Sialidase n=2 Tax=Chloropicon primus TaxID=1764295 RepID=A0A5B8MDY7_9CHLO|nr:sialidase [Chloropicon primus]|eukprot:QDZ17512.1 sialidase [Chloropicon primus]
MRKKLHPVRDLEEGGQGEEEDHDEDQKNKNFPLPHWLVPVRTQIRRRPLTSVLAVAGLLLVAIVVISVQDVEEPSRRAVPGGSHLMSSWQDARSAANQETHIPLKGPKDKGRHKEEPHRKEEPHHKEKHKDAKEKPHTPKKAEKAPAKGKPKKSGATAHGHGSKAEDSHHDVPARDHVEAVHQGPFANLKEPEFAFGGKWGHREGRAQLTQSGVLSPACHATTLVNLPDGEVLAAWFGGMYESAEDVAIYVAKRQTTGEWTTPLKAAKVHRDVPFNGKEKRGMPPKKGGEPHWNPVLFCEGSQGSEDVCDGEIVLFFKVGWKIPEWETFVTKSSDGGKTWGEATELVSEDQPWQKGGRGPVKNKPILLSNGDWLAPASLEGPAHWEGRAKPWRAFTDISTDHGETWEMSTLAYPESKHEGMIQPTLWEDSANPGHVFMMTRSTRDPKARVWRANSTDYGRTWNKPYKTSLPNNNSGLDVAKLPRSGFLVLIYNPVHTTRTPLRLAVSKDNGETWPIYIDLEREKGEVRSGREFSYPAIIPWPASAEEEGVSMTYTWNRKRVAYFQISLKELEERSNQRNSHQS